MEPLVIPVQDSISKVNFNQDEVNHILQNYGGSKTNFEPLNTIASMNFENYESESFNDLGKSVIWKRVLDYVLGKGKVEN